MTETQIPSIAEGRAALADLQPPTQLFIDR